MALTRIGISGAIAVGKTTLVRLLKENEPSWSVASEVVEAHRFLERFYGDPQRWAFHSRIEFLSIKAAQMLSSEEGSWRRVRESNAPTIGTPTVKIFDRTLPELITFATVMRDSRVLSDDEFELYERLYSELVATLPEIDATLWLRADSQVCLNRIRKRGRAFEQGIDLPYLESLDDAYSTWFSGLVGPKLELDTSADEWWSTTGNEVVDWIRSRAS